MRVPACAARCGAVRLVKGTRAARPGAVAEYFEPLVRPASRGESRGRRGDRTAPATDPDALPLRGKARLTE